MKNVLILLIIFFAVRTFRKYLTAKHKREAGLEAAKGPSSVASGKGEEMVLDPVCNSYVPVTSALRVKNGDRTEYFCGEECRSRFIASEK